MALREEFDAQGAFLFRWRSYLPLVLIVVMLPSAITYRHPNDSHDFQECWEFVCLGVSLLGVAIRCVTVGHTPQGTSGRNTKRQIAMEFNASGMYSIVRHPLYLGNYFMWIGVSMFFLTWWLTLIFTLLFWIYYERIMFAEEEFLRGKFGEPYLSWAARTPAFIPNPRRPAALPFSLRNVLKREYAGFAGMILAFVALDLTEELVTERRLYIDELWQVLAPLSFAGFLVLRFLKRRTTVLHVPGR